MLTTLDSADLNKLSQTQRERLAYIEVKAYFCGDLSRADIERRFGVKPAASARDLAMYRKLAPNNLLYEASSRRHVPTHDFRPIFEHSADRVLTWLRLGIGDGLDLRLKRTVPCESSSDLGVWAPEHLAYEFSRAVRLSFCYAGLP
jgi:hypothetical protein